MSLFSSVGNAVGGPLGDAIQVADQFVQQAVPGLGFLNQIVNVQSGSDGVSRQLHNNALSQQQDDIRRSDKRGGRGGQQGGGCQPQGCTGGGGGGNTLEMLAEVLGSMQERRVKSLIEKGQTMANASDDELLKLSTQIQTDKFLLDAAVDASKKVIEGIGQNMAKPMQN